MGEIPAEERAELPGIRYVTAAVTGHDEAVPADWRNVVMSVWGAQHTTMASALGGLDMAMLGDGCAMYTAASGAAR